MRLRARSSIALSTTRYGKSWTPWFGIDWNSTKAWRSDVEVKMTLEKLITNFELLGDWEERYGYLIDLGKKLPGLPEAEKTEENRVHGCQAMVWLVMEPDPEHPGALRFRADSDAFIVRGLIAVLQLLFNHHTPEEILKID